MAKKKANDMTQENTLKIKYALLGTITTICIALLTWGVTVETRLAYANLKCKEIEARVGRETDRFDATVERIEAILVRIEEKLDRKADK